MFTIAVANIKGGSGKSTVATNLAAHFSLKGERVVLGELDRQKTALSWLERRPKSAAPIAGVDLNKDDATLPPADILVVDAGAAMRRDAVKDVVMRADIIVVPVLPSIFDEDATRRFFDQLCTLKPIRKSKRDVAFVANRVKPRTKAAERLDGFLAELDFPAVAQLRDSQLYAHAALEGLSLFEMPLARARSYIEEWWPLVTYIESSRLGMTKRKKPG
ncbi:MAG: chromosome partitioning protein ParA [Alphaproteobacteria bacterium RIFOXYD12_FULL_60_8]|nr:MAG: chromosome partitioning protein ParA [Alphaproteobacteria bacterium RIFOXYD12_FULL_60_8]